MNKKMLWIGGGIALLVGMAAALTFLFTRTPSYRGTSFSEPYPVAGEIALKKADGQIFRLSDEKGKVILLYFGYTSCPDVCPATLAEMAQVLKKIGTDASRVQVLFVTVDPKRDTPEKMQEYASRFDPTFIGLTGTMDELQPIWDAYSIYREETDSTSALGTIVNHTARSYLIDPQGDLRLSYAYGTPIDDIVHDVKLVLKEKQ